jgi:hypothetical protein
LFGVKKWHGPVGVEAQAEATASWKPSSLVKKIQSEIWVVLVYYLGGPAGEGNDQNHLKPNSKVSSWEISPPSQLNITLDPISPR